MNARLWLMAAGLLGFLGVAIGAFGAHALRERLDAAQMATFRTGVEYHLIHALALFGVAILMRSKPLPLLHTVAACFALGIVLFAGSLYALTLTGVRGLGVITPFGGLAFLAGWGLLVFAAWREG